jgi:hypothetical protein
MKEPTIEVLVDSTHQGLHVDVFEMVSSVEHIAV